MNNQNKSYPVFVFSSISLSHIKSFMFNLSCDLFICLFKPLNTVRLNFKWLPVHCISSLYFLDIATITWPNISSIPSLKEQSRDCISILLKISLCWLMIAFKCSIFNNKGLTSWFFPCVFCLFFDYYILIFICTIWAKGIKILPPLAVFTVMCYNVLCDKYATRQLYGYCPSWALNWEYRKKGIMEEITSCDADIISLQVCEPDMS